MANAKHRPATYADIEALPPHVTGQIAYGVLHTMGRPSARHGHAAFELTGELRDPFRRGSGGPGGWRFLPEPELGLGEHTLVPDIAGWRIARGIVFPQAGRIPAAPDWICEILSPSTQRFDRTDKLTIYATYEIAHCWYVDPNARTLEVFQRQNDKWLLAATFKDADVVTAAPFEAHSFSLDTLWLPDDEQAE